MSNTSIEWTDRTWNPVRGCSRISPGCRNCYAERIAARFSDPGQPFHLYADRKRKGSKWTGEIGIQPEKLNDPATWRKPQRVFVNSMSDLFHEHLEFADIDRVWRAMLDTPRHTFQVLTKRAERMLEYLRFGCSHNGIAPHWIWLGASVEDRRHGLPRVEQLRQCPARVRFLSVEPLLEDLGEIDLRGIQWVIIGGESGHGARQISLKWVRSIKDQCLQSGVSVFVKQITEHGRKIPFEQWPSDLRLRNFPEVRP